MSARGLFDARAFLAALITVIAALAIAELTIRSNLNQESLARWDSVDFLSDERDDHGRIVASVIAMQSRAEDRSDLVFVGGSTLREALLPDPIIQRDLDASSDASIVATLYSFDQSLAETARVVLNLPLGPEDTVVISVNPRRLSFPPTSLADERFNSRLSLLSRDVLDPLIDGSGVSGWEDALFTPWNHLRLFETRLFLRSWMDGRLKRTTDAWSDLGSLNWGEVEWSALLNPEPRTLRAPLRYGYPDVTLGEAERAQIAAEVAAIRVGEYLEHSPFGFNLLDETITELQSTGAHVVILELPRTAASVAAYEPVWNDYDDRIAALSDARGVTRLDLRHAGFEDADFYDLEHLRAQARPVITELVLDGLAQSAATE